MPYFIVGIILSVIVIISIFGLCIFLIKKSKNMSKLPWYIYVVVVSIFIIGILAVFFVFYGGMQVNPAI